MVGKETTPIPPPPRGRAGAPQRWIWEVSKRLSENNEVTIFSPGSRTVFRTEDGISIFYKEKREPGIRRPGLIPFTYTMLTYYMGVLPILKRLNPDIIHLHSTSPHPIPLAKNYFRNTPVVLSVHQCVGFRTLSLPFKGIEDRLVRYSFRHADKILPVSNYVKRFLKSSYSLSENEKLSVTYCGVDPSLFTYNDKLAKYTREKYGLSDNPTILFVGRIVPEKGLHILMRAYQLVRKRIPNARLVIVGPFRTSGQVSPYAANVIKKCSNGIAFIGPSPHEELVALDCAADIFVNPTIIPEAFGMVNIEAMACEKPVIATRIGAIPEVVDDGKTGVLVPPRQPKALAHAILSLLENPSIMREMGIAGRRKVLEHFTWDHVTHRTLDAYNQLVKNQI